MAPPFHPRQVVYLRPFHGEPHPAIVLRLHRPDLAFVVGGTSTPIEATPEKAPGPYILVTPAMNEYGLMGLWAPTYFYKARLKTVLQTDADLTDRKCPPDLFLQIVKMFEQP